MDWLEGWEYRKKLTVSGARIQSDLSDFPILIVLASGVGTNNADVTDVFDELSDSYLKLAVTTSGGSQCYVEVEYWSSVSGTAYLWFKAPTLSSGINTEFYFYYDAGHADNTSYVGTAASGTAANVWDSNFIGVWHMHNAPSGTDSVKDSTSNSRHMTPTGMTGSEIFNGQVGRTIDFDGSSDYLTCSTTPSTPSSWTFEGWVKPDTASSTKAVIGLAGEALAMEGSTTSWCVVSSNNAQYKAHAVTTGTYIYVVGVKDGSSYYIYEDGVEYHTSTSNAGWAMSGLKIAQGYSSNRFDGRIDEVRGSTIARSPFWIRANYYSMQDDLLDFGVTENAPHWYFSGHVEEAGSPVARQIYVYRRDTGVLTGATVSSGVTGDFYLETTYSGQQFIVCLNVPSEYIYNALIYDGVIPLLVS